MPTIRRTPSSDWVALILAIGLATALNLITAAVMYDAVRSDTPGLSENATQILTGWGGGVIGILGAVFGYRAGSTPTSSTTTTTTTPEDDLEP